MRDVEFAALIEANLAAVRAYARALTSDAHTAEDAVQETLLRAWRYIDTYDRRRPFQPWVIRICRNCVADLMVRESRLPAGERTAPYESCAPELLGASTESVVDLLDLISSLPLPHREVLVVVSVLGYSYDDAAALLGIPVGTVRSRFSRARTALSCMLRQAEDASRGEPTARPA